MLPNALLGVRNVGMAPPRYQPENKLLYPNLDLLTEKLYYLKHDSPRVYVNVRGHTGNYRKDTMVGPKPLAQTTHELRDTTASVKKRSKVPKKFDASRHSFEKLIITTESPLVTSSELPKQIPAPPSKVPVRFPIVHTTPVQRQPRREIVYLSTETWKIWNKIQASVQRPSSPNLSQFFLIRVRICLEFRMFFRTVVCIGKL